MIIQFPNRSLFFVMLLLSFSMNEEAIAQNSVGDITNNQGIITQGQQGNNTLIQGPQRLKFSNALGAELLKNMPVKKKVVLRSIGGESDQRVGTDIQNFLQKNGYEITRQVIGMLVPPPDRKISLNESPEGYLLTIAPSAN